MATKDSFAWHSNPAVHKRIDKFHETYCKEPTKDMQKARGTLVHLTRHVIQPQLKKMGMKGELIVSGSSFQGLKVQNDVLEFDVGLCFHDKTARAVTCADDSYYATLRPKPGKEFSGPYQLTGDGTISGDHWRNKFQSMFAFFQNTIPELGRDKVTFREHGAAIQMDVLRDDGSVWFNVDLVPTIMSGKGEDRKRHVYKRYSEGSGEGTGENTGRGQSEWIRSFAREECLSLCKADQGSGCRKEAIRVLKYIRNEEPNLDKLSSYHLKATLLNDMNNNPDKSWNKKQLGERVIDLLGSLRGSLATGHLSHPFLADHNLLGDMSREVRNNIHGRINTLYTKEKEFMKATTC